MPGFESSEGLRVLLTRLHAQGRGAWRDDPEVAALMRHAADRYAALARKHGLDPWEAAAAAFDAMRTPSVRKADDPWAVVTRAVQVSCIAEERANGLLCSVHQARRPRYSIFHDAERFSDRENLLTDYHPAFQTAAVDYGADDAVVRSIAVGVGSTDVRSAIEDTIALFTLLGWPASTARAGVEYVCTRLTESTSRASAFETLRRDYHARALLDLPGTSWLAMLRVLLGNPDPDLAHTDAGRGALRRLLADEPLRALLADDAVLAEVVLSVPTDRGRGRA
ncbi:hypothetical protein [Leifsonia aquatica]|uniref:hypothetical protein n=1 Tax=Leifsonia aquatica TaxID=144185 RepID=UPI0028B22391|nr:hypothetical protein [Leifsonia aquatica]